jgi:hypothetical protein
MQYDCDCSTTEKLALRRLLRSDIRLQLRDSELVFPQISDQTDEGDWSRVRLPS